LTVSGNSGFLAPVLRSALAPVMRLAQDALAKAGIYADLRRRLPRGVDWLLDVQRMLAPRSPALMFDVGANVGQTTTSMKHRFPSVEVHAFEPVGSTFAELRTAVGHLPGVHCHQLALSDREGTHTMSVVPGSVFNSLAAPVFEKHRTVVPEEVRLTTLDRFIVDHGIGSIDVLKTDTEGHDFEVLVGANAALSEGRIGCVYTEVTFNTANQQNSQFGPIFDRLQSLGYRFMGLYEMDFMQINPWNISFCNALFVRSALLARP
jgi:FkbM family methyltransferase